MNITSFDAKVRKLTRCTILDLSGDIDASAGQSLENVTSSDEVTNSTNIILNFSDVDYINSTGIALLVKLMSGALKRQQRIFACGLNEHYCEVFEITRLVDFMPVFRDLDEVFAGTTL